MTIGEHLDRLLKAYGVTNAETAASRVEGYQLAARGQTVATVARAVDDFIGGIVDRKKGSRGKPPTSDEFGGHLRSLAKVIAATAGRGDMEYAPPFGPLWGLKLYDRLKDGPDAVMPKATAVVRQMIEQGGEVGARYALHHQAAVGFGAVNSMMSAASWGKGCMVEVTLKVHLDRMEAVPVGGDTLKAWRVVHEARGWPWLPDTGTQRVVYMPKDGERGLAELLAALGPGGGGSKV